MAYHAGPQAKAKRKGDGMEMKKMKKGNERNWNQLDKKANGLTRKWIEKKINRKSNGWKKVINRKEN